MGNARAQLRRIAFAIAASAVVLALDSVAQAATISVNTTADDNTVNGNCTLREAVRAHNSHAAVDACLAGTGDDAIVVPSGTYNLSIPGDSEDAAATGDLDLSELVQIIGTAPAATIIDGGDLDRVFHVLPGASVLLHSLTIRNGKLDSDGPTYEGGGVLSVAADTVIDSCVITGNDSNYSGGGVAAIDGTLTIRDSTLSANRCNFGTGSNGCAVSITGTSATAATLLVEGTTISGNRNQSGFASAVYVNGTGEGDTLLTMRNSTISDNFGDTVMGTSTSGGIYVNDGPLVNGGDTTADLNNVTIVDNTDVGVYGFSNTPATVRVDLRNSIVADNDTYDCEGRVFSGGHNVIGDAVPPFMLSIRVCDFSMAAGDQVVADPLLDALANNGGATETRAPQVGSPALNAGSQLPPGSGGTACEADDQRGVARFGCDSGAYDDGATAGCAAEALSGCRTTTAASLLMKDKDADGPGAGDRLVWKWRDDLSVTSDFDDPTAGTRYSACVYGDDGGTLVLVATVAAGGICGSRNCWLAANDGYRFSDMDALQDGIKKVSFKASAAPGAARVQFQGGGMGLNYTGLPLDTDVRVQLTRSDSALCWESAFGLESVQKSGTALLKAKLP